MSSLSANARFARQPSMVGNIPRSRFDRTFDLKTTFNAGKLIPIFYDDLLPGDTVTLDVKSLVRMATPVTPTMDNAYCSVHFFAVPLRLVWDDFKYFMGENKDSSWAPTTYPTPPKIGIDVGGPNGVNDRKVYIGSVADYFGIPPTKNSDLRDNFYNDFIPEDNTESFYINAWAFRGYTLIWNHWFRSEAIMDPAYCPLDSNSRSYSIDPDPLVSAHLGGALLPVCKFFDYFTGALPDAQRGEPIGIPVSANPWMPVATRNENALDQVINAGYSSSNKLTWTGTDLPSDIAFNVAAYSDEAGDYADAIPGEATPYPGSGFMTPANLFALGTTGAMGTINDLRLAFQLQRMLERDARGGGRYISLVLNHFGVRSPDARQQVPEYVGGFRTRIGMQSVAQTSSTDSTSPQGNLAAYSLTTDHSNVLTYSSTEHCMLIGVADVRTEHTYGFGIDRSWFIDDRYDFYWPALANIGELPILNREICIYGTDRNEFFGYQEAWASLRYKKNELSGYMRSQLKETLSYWHYGDDYSETPKLSPSWLEETPKNIDRTLAVQSDTSHQFIANFQFIYHHTREMPMYSIPGLIDHN